jgi:hypothetical protein
MGSACAEKEGIERVEGGEWDQREQKKKGIERGEGVEHIKYIHT